MDLGFKPEIRKDLGLSVGTTCQEVENEKQGGKRTGSSVYIAVHRDYVMVGDLLLLLYVRPKIWYGVFRVPRSTQTWVVEWESPIIVYKQQTCFTCHGHPYCDLRDFRGGDSGFRVAITTSSSESPPPQLLNMILFNLVPSQLVRRLGSVAGL